MTHVKMRMLTAALLGASAVAIVGFGPVQAAPQGDMNMPHGQLENAVRLIEQQTNGHVIEIKESAGTFNAIVASGHREMQPVRLDANAGVMPLAAPDDSLHPMSRLRMHDAQRARIDLSQAILTAEEAMPGRPVAADFTEAGAIMAYNVDIKMEGHIHRVVVDALSGQVIADPSGLPS